MCDIVTMKRLKQGARDEEASLPYFCAAERQQKRIFGIQIK